MNRRNLLTGAAAAAVVPVLPAALALAEPVDALLVRWREACAVAGAAAERTAAAAEAFLFGEGKAIVDREGWDALLGPYDSAAGALHREEDRLFKIVDGLAEQICARPPVTFANIAARLEIALDHMPDPGDCYGAKLVTELLAEVRRGGAA
jgi:hypothetical protein